MNGFSFNVNTIGIPNVCTAPWNLQHIKDLKMTEWSVETCIPIISGNKCCADVNNWLIIYLSTSCCLYTRKASPKTWKIPKFGAGLSGKMVGGQYNQMTTVALTSHALVPYFLTGAGIWRLLSVTATLKNFNTYWQSLCWSNEYLHDWRLWGLTLWRRNYFLFNFSTLCT